MLGRGFLIDWFNITFSGQPKHHKVLSWFVDVGFRVSNSVWAWLVFNTPFLLSLPPPLHSSDMALVPGTRQAPGV